MCGLDSGYRIYNTDPLKENAREGNHNNINQDFDFFRVLDVFMTSLNRDYC